MRLSACVVVKNEAVTLGATLDSLRGRADEILVIDGGSTDGSQEIARAAGARMFFDPGNITTARNRALREARGDLRVMIDADEVVDDTTWDALWAFVREGKHSLGRILQVSETERGTASLWITRACTRDRRFYYDGAVHEQLVGAGSCGNTGLTVLHSGYTAEAFARKGAIERNLRLLELEVQVRPDDAYVNYQLGKTLLVAKRAPEAVTYLRRSLERLPSDAAYASELGCDLGYALRQSGRLAEALAIARRFQERFPDYTDLHFLEGVCQLHLGKAAEMRAAFERCIALGEARGYATVHGVGTYRAHYNLGLFFELAGDVKRARRHYESALVSGSAFPLAQERLTGLDRAPSEA